MSSKSSVWSQTLDLFSSTNLKVLRTALSLKIGVAANTSSNHENNNNNNSNGEKTKRRMEEEQQQQQQQLAVARAFRILNNSKRKTSQQTSGFPIERIERKLKLFPTTNHKKWMLSHVLAFGLQFPSLNTTRSTWNHALRCVSAFSSSASSLKLDSDTQDLLFLFRASYLDPALRLCLPFRLTGVTEIDQMRLKFMPKTLIRKGLSEWFVPQEKQDALLLFSSSSQQEQQQQQATAENEQIVDLSKDPKKTTTTKQRSEKEWNEIFGGILRSYFPSSASSSSSHKNSVKDEEEYRLQVRRLIEDEFFASSSSSPSPSTATGKEGEDGLDCLEGELLCSNLVKVSMRVCSNFEDLQWILARLLSAKSAPFLLRKRFRLNQMGQLQEQDQKEGEEEEQEQEDNNTQEEEEEEDDDDELPDFLSKIRIDDVIASAVLEEASMHTHNSFLEKGRLPFPAWFLIGCSLSCLRHVDRKFPPASLLVASASSIVGRWEEALEIISSTTSSSSSSSSSSTSMMLVKERWECDPELLLFTTCMVSGLMKQTKNTFHDISSALKTTFTVTHVPSKEEYKLWSDRIHTSRKRLLTTQTHWQDSIRIMQDLFGGNNFAESGYTFLVPSSSAHLGDALCFAPPAELERAARILMSPFLSGVAQAVRSFGIVYQDEENPSSSSSLSTTLRTLLVGTRALFFLARLNSKSQACKFGMLSSVLLEFALRFLLCGKCKNEDFFSTGETSDDCDEKEMMIREITINVRKLHWLLFQHHQKRQNKNNNTTTTNNNKRDNNNTDSSSSIMLLMTPQIEVSRRNFRYLFLCLAFYDMCQMRRKKVHYKDRQRLVRALLLYSNNPDPASLVSTRDVENTISHARASMFRAALRLLDSVGRLKSPELPALIIKESRHFSSWEKTLSFIAHHRVLREFGSSQQDLDAAAAAAATSTNKEKSSNKINKNNKIISKKSYQHQQQQQRHQQRPELLNLLLEETALTSCPSLESTKFLRISRNDQTAWKDALVILAEESERRFEKNTTFAEEFLYRCMRSGAPVQMIHRLGRCSGALSKSGSKLIAEYVKKKKKEAEKMEEETKPEETEKKIT